MVNQLELTIQKRPFWYGLAACVSDPAGILFRPPFFCIIWPYFGDSFFVRKQQKSLFKRKKRHFSVPFSCDSAGILFMVLICS